MTPPRMKIKYLKDIIKNDSSLTESEKKFLLNELKLKYDEIRIASGNNEIDKLIRECQQKTIAPNRVIEWIECDQFEEVEYLAEGGYGRYYKWNSERQILERFGRQKIVLKRLNNSSNNNVNWFHEVISSFTLGDISLFLVTCYGLTKDPSTQDYMLNYYDNSLYEIHEQNIIQRFALWKYFYYSQSVAWHISDS
ncbi:hypothetical protein Glove_476g4 [Diversispora epigaea]|uniref:Protein kinase domain-containing protein n=1 Tax=Diversispora epigaea TaxID=1348612 RepID=A0A397GL74_9GLOM|nr:hypothetical protein Glove_476g4 [Diversispora epigaea]